MEPTQAEGKHKFGNRDYVKNALSKKDKEIEVIEKHHAEEDPAVACASILARNEFLRRLDELSALCKHELPKGASDITVDSRAIHYNELRVVGVSDSRPEHVEMAVQFMAEGKIDAGPIALHKLGLEDLLQGLQLMRAKESLKVLVDPRV